MADKKGTAGATGQHRHDTCACWPALARNRAQREPFSYILATGWHDGPSEGFARCARCNSAFRFRQVAWDEKKDWRVHAFAPFSRRRLAEITSLVEQFSTRRPESILQVPIWHPTSFQEQVFSDLAGEMGEPRFATFSRTLYKAVAAAPGLATPDVSEAVEGARTVAEWKRWLTAGEWA